MILTKIWERYFFKEALKTSLLFLCCFYGLYILIDYVHHAGHFRGNDGHFDWKIFSIYYVSDFIVKSELLIPLAILLGTIKVLCKLNVNNELIALMVSGIKTSRLLRPFLIFGLLGTASLYLNNQFLLPLAAKELKYIEDSRSKQDHSTQLAAQHLVLDDHSTLLFQRYDSSRDLFFDVFWIRSSEQIYRIKELYFSTPLPTGIFIDILTRADNGNLIVSSSSSSSVFPEMQFNEKKLIDSLTLPEDLSLTNLWSKISFFHPAESEKQARLISTFHHKLISPLLCLLAVIGPAPFCIQFSRRFPTFLIYACAIFGFMAGYIILNAAHVLGRRQFIDPVIAIWLPFLILTTLSCYRSFYRFKAMYL